MVSEQMVDLSRLQFAATALYHFLFVPLTIGMVWILVIMESVYVMTGKPLYKDMTRFWGKLFGINFALGVTTGITLEFQFGTNWAYYSHYVGDIFGAPLAIEGLMAFFLESTMIGLFFFGWDRLSRRKHPLVTVLMAVGTNLSALRILIANGWMQNPVGAWFANYRAYPATQILPALGIVGVFAAQAPARSGISMAAFWASALAVVGVVGTAGAALFPFIMPSSLDPRTSLTVWDSVSSQLTLSIMRWATLIFMPIIILYTSWAYQVMRGKVTAAYVRENSHSAC